MNTTYPYCRVHGNNPCRCHTIIAHLQRDGFFHQQDASSSGAETESSVARPSPNDTSSSGTYSSKRSASGPGTTLARSAFSPLAQCLKESNHEEATEQSHGIDLPLTVGNGAQNRLQLLQRFYDLHLGSSFHARAIFRYEDIGSGSIGRITTTSAMDALCVAQVATSFGDGHLMVESRRLYSRTMQLLGAKIRAIGDSTPSPDHLDDIVGAVHALTATSWFCCVGVGALDWTKHAQALLRVLKVFGWDAMSPDTQRTFRYNWKYRAFWDGIARRIAVNYKDPATESIHRDLSSTLLELGFRTCDVLERSDRFLAAGHRKRPKEVQVTSFLTEVGALVALLKKWHLTWTKTAPSRPRQKIVSAKQFSNFRSISREFFGIFPTASDFSHPAHERDYRILNICLLNLDEAIMDVHAAYPEHCTSSEMRLQLRAAEYDAATCAAELAMVVPWSSQPSNGAFACIHAMQPLQWASRHYRKHGKVLQLEWCQQVTETLSEKYGIRVKLWEDSAAFVHG